MRRSSSDSSVELQLLIFYKMKKRFIKSRDDMDSACVLYALVNAVNCLRGQQLRMPGPWQCLIDAIYDPRHFLRSETGTLAIDEYSDLLERLVGDYVEKLDGKGGYSIVRIRPVTGSTKLVPLLTSNSVMLIATDEHWRCLIDADDTDVFFACSAVWKDDPTLYSEQESPRLHRTYNDRCARPTLECWKGPAFVVSRTAG
jgi:hypothetical protein